MKKIYTIIITLLLVGIIALTVGCPTIESRNDISNNNELNDEVGFDSGPAPNSGDGIPDGSGFQK